MGTVNASENLEQYLEKIKEIEKDSHFIPDSYDSFKRDYLKFDLNQHTRTQIETNEREGQLNKRNEQEKRNFEAKAKNLKSKVDNQMQ